MILSQWEETQDNLNLTMQRNTFGLHAPIRLLMERELVQKVSPALHLQLARGRSLTPFTLAEHSHHVVLKLLQAKQRSPGCAVGQG